MNPEYIERQYNTINEKNDFFQRNQRFRVGIMRIKPFLKSKKFMTLPAKLSQQKPKSQGICKLAKSYYNVEFNPQDLFSRSMDAPKNGSRQKFENEQNKNKFKKQLPFQKRKQASSKIRLIKQIIQQRHDKQFLIDGTVLQSKQLRKGSMPDKYLPKEIVNYEKYSNKLNTTSRVYRKRIKDQIFKQTSTTSSSQEIRLSGIKMQKGDYSFIDQLRFKTANFNQHNNFNIVQSKIQLAKESFLKIQERKNTNKYLRNINKQRSTVKTFNFTNNRQTVNEQKRQENFIKSKKDIVISPWESYQQVHQY